MTLGPRFADVRRGFARWRRWSAGREVTNVPLARLLRQPDHAKGARGPDEERPFQPQPPGRRKLEEVSASTCTVN
jgi:hypothetical protein